MFRAFALIAIASTLLTVGCSKSDNASDGSPDSISSDLRAEAKKPTAFNVEAVEFLKQMRANDRATLPSTDLILKGGDESALNAVGQKWLNTARTSCTLVKPDENQPENPNGTTALSERISGPGCPLSHRSDEIRTMDLKESGGRVNGTMDTSLSVDTQILDSQMRQETKSHRLLLSASVKGFVRGVNEDQSEGTIKFNISGNATMEVESGQVSLVMRGEALSRNRVEDAVLIIDISTPKGSVRLSVVGNPRNSPEYYIGGQSVTREQFDEIFDVNNGSTSPIL